MALSLVETTEYGIERSIVMTIPRTIHERYADELKDKVMHFNNHNIFAGTIWAFSLQILVGKSTRSADQEYKTLLSGVNLMTPKDCRQEQNKQKLRMFKYGNIIFLLINVLDTEASLKSVLRNIEIPKLVLIDNIEIARTKVKDILVGLRYISSI